MARLLVLAIILGVIAVPAFLWAFQTWGVYRFPQSGDGPETLSVSGVEKVSLTAYDGAPITVWVAQPAADKPVIISFHGNFTEIAPSFERVAGLASQGFGVIMLQYRGSGGAPGHLNEVRMKSDATTVYDSLDQLVAGGIGSHPVFVHGYSLGSSPGIWLAAHRPVDGLIVEAGYARLYEYWERRYKGIPIFRLMWAERNENINIISDVTAPILMVHGQNDPAVPIAWSKALFAAATAPKRYITYPQGMHADLTSHGVLDDIAAFAESPSAFVTQQ